MNQATEHFRRMIRVDLTANLRILFYRSSDFLQAELNVPDVAKALGRLALAAKWGCIKDMVVSSGSGYLWRIWDGTSVARRDEDGAYARPCSFKIHPIQVLDTYARGSLPHEVCEFFGLPVARKSEQVKELGKFLSEMRSRPADENQVAHMVKWVRFFTHPG
jgi:hypothetical protein